MALSGTLYPVDSPSGRAAMRRARETLKPGDIVWYPALSDLRLVVVLRIENGKIAVRGLFPFDTSGERTLMFHGDWELVGHDAALLTAHDESEVPSGP